MLGRFVSNFFTRLFKLVSERNRSRVEHWKAGPSDCGPTLSIQPQSSRGPPAPRRIGYFTLKLVEDRTVPDSSVTSTPRFPDRTDLLLQVRVEATLSWRGY